MSSPEAALPPTLEKAEGGSVYHEQGAHTEVHSVSQASGQQAGSAQTRPCLPESSRQPEAVGQQIWWHVGLCKAVQLEAVGQQILWHFGPCKAEQLEAVGQQIWWHVGPCKAVQGSAEGVLQIA